MPNGKRLWRTDDGALVEDGHPDARLLAYGESDPLEGDDLKATKRPEDKQVKAPRNKAAK